MSDGPRHDDNGISARWWALGGASVLLVLALTVEVFGNHERNSLARIAPGYPHAPP